MVVRETFDGFALDSEARTLIRDGAEVRVRSKAFDLLCVLVHRRPRVATRDELRSLLWPGVTVTNASLDELVKVLRRALSDDAKQPRYIKTHPGGRGFSFCWQQAERRTGPAEFRLLWQGRILPLADGTNLVGRSDSCDVVIAHDTVSRRHAMIRCDSATGEAVIEHLSTVNRTVVSGVVVKTTRQLVSGDAVELGSAQLEFRRASDATKTLKTSRASGHGSANT